MPEAETHSCGASAKSERSSVTTGVRPILRRTLTSPARSSQPNARYLALRSRPNRSPEILLRGTDLDRARPAANHSATPACRDLPGSLAAASSHDTGTALPPLANGSCSSSPNEWPLNWRPSASRCEGCAAVEQCPESVPGPPCPARMLGCDTGAWKGSTKSMRRGSERDVSQEAFVTFRDA